MIGASGAREKNTGEKTLRLSEWNEKDFVAAVGASDFSPCVPTANDLNRL
jgi:hypothetical protein